YDISDLNGGPYLGKGVIETLAAAGYSDGVSLISSGITMQSSTKGISQNAKVTGSSNGSGTLKFGGLADADGDGVADSRWVEIPNMRSSTGEQVYTAVRVIDNGG